MLRREPEGQLDCRVLRVHLPLPIANDERWFDPRAGMHVSGQIDATAHGEERDKGRFTFFEHHGPPSHDDELRGCGCGFDTSPLLVGEHTGEQAAGAR